MLIKEKSKRNKILSTNSYKTNLWNYLRNKDESSYSDIKALGLIQDSFPFMDTESTEYFREKLTEKSVVRKEATVLKNDVDSSSIVTFPNKSMATWTKSGEHDLFTAVLEMKDVDVNLEYNTLSNLITIHEDFLNNPQTKIEKIILDTFVHNFAKAEDKAFIIGDGNGEPLGILVDEKIKCLSASKELKLDDLKKLFFSLDNEYRENAKWIMNDKTALYLQSLKDIQGNFLWNQYDGYFMGKEILISNFMPDIDADKKPVAFGDFSNYWIIERQNPTIKRLEEVFVLKQHQGFIMREYLDAKLMDKDSVLTLAIEG
ncbi:MAG: phage major capsid protein [Peptoniphilus sp.]|uniref:phage major capsid protein n=1 Tax=Peptoniphilus sp. TaxID=1971214 RepID=UPI003994C514